MIGLMSVRVLVRDRGRVSAGFQVEVGLGLGILRVKVRVILNKNNQCIFHKDQLCF